MPDTSGERGKIKRWIRTEETTPIGSNGELCSKKTIGEGTNLQYVTHRKSLSEKRNAGGTYTVNLLNACNPFKLKIYVAQEYENHEK